MARLRTTTRTRANFHRETSLLLLQVSTACHVKMRRSDFPTDALDQLRRARSIAVLTGAGISAESGVPTFRDAQTGHWAKFNPEELATPAAFRRNPKLVWEWY